MDQRFYRLTVNYWQPKVDPSAQSNWQDHGRWWFICVSLCDGGSGRLRVCNQSFPWSLSPHFLFQPVSMPLNRVIVPTVRQATVCVSICVLLLQGADSREVCLNRGAQRPRSSCRVWIPVIGPPFSPSISLSVLDCLSIFGSVSAKLHLPHFLLYSTFSCFLFLCFVCMF